MALCAAIGLLLRVVAGTVFAPLILLFVVARYLFRPMPERIRVYKEESAFYPLGVASIAHNHRLAIDTLLQPERRRH